MRGAITFLLTVVVCAISLEVAARAFWRLKFGIPITHPERILHSLYPEMRSVEERRPTRGGAVFDVLLLGGSTLNLGWGQVQPALREELARRGQKNVRIYNLAMPGHTSQDSRVKYSRLGQSRFDLVVVYDGLNETRTNNAPPDVFRDDYGHYGWYELINALAPYHGQAKFALPYTVRRVAIGVRQSTRRNRYVATDTLQPEWIQYAANTRSVVPFERNLSQIIALAAERGDPLLLMTFATYIPDNYSNQAFEEKSLSYGLHLTPIEAWGAREHVVAALSAHNAIVRKLVAQHRTVMFVDQATLMQGVPGYFNDICHFTIAGAVKFAENLVAALAPSSLAAPGRAVAADSAP